MDALLVVKHPDKTFVGRIARGFEFLGFAFSDGGVWVATDALVCLLSSYGKVSLGRFLGLTWLLLALPQQSKPYSTQHLPNPS